MKRPMENILEIFRDKVQNYEFLTARDSQIKRYKKRVLSFGMKKGLCKLYTLVASQRWESFLITINEQFSNIRIVYIIHRHEIITGA